MLLPLDLMAVLIAIRHLLMLIRLSDSLRHSAHTRLIARRIKARLIG
jgi:hypothetical protein